MSEAVSTICLLGFGEVGAILAEDLLRLSSVRIVVWDRLFPVSDSLPNRRFANFSESERIAKANSAAEAAMAADLVISVVTAEQDLAAAESVQFALKPLAWYLDLNSVSPGTKIQVARCIGAAGGRYVEAAVMAPIAPGRIDTRIILAGDHAEQFLPVARALGFGAMAAISTAQGQAAASKMCRSLVVKGLEALITEALLAARHYGVEREVLDSLANLFPHTDWQRQAAYLISRSLQHGSRRAEEMREVVKTVREAGVDPWMSEACVRRQDWAGGLAVAFDPPELTTMLDDMRNHSFQPAIGNEQ